jgi:hypothetical protein
MYRVRSRNIENRTVPRMKPATFEPVSVRRRKIENGTSGSAWRRSQPMKATARTADATKTPIVRADDQPHSRPCVMPRTSSSRCEVTSTAPSASKPCVRSSRLSRRSSGVSARATTPIGTLIQKIHSQDMRSVSTPPRRTPAAAPNPPTAPQTPSAMLRSRPSANVAVRRARAAGETAAAPRPCRPRNRISETSLQAKPQRSEPTVNTTSPSAKTRLRPKRSPSLPPRSRKPPKARA